MSIEQGIIPTPSDDPFYDALIKRLWLDDGSVEYPGDQLIFEGHTTGQVGQFMLSDYHQFALKEALPIPKRNEQSRRGLLARGLGCLSIELQVPEEPFKRSYTVTRPSDLSEEPDRMFGLPFMREHYHDLDNHDLSQSRVFRFMPKPDETIIDTPLEHPYLREVYEEITRTF